MSRVAVAENDGTRELCPGCNLSSPLQVGIPRNLELTFLQDRHENALPCKRNNHLRELSISAIEGRDLRSLNCWW
jgi:hypothetical protein